MIKAARHGFAPWRGAFIFFFFFYRAGGPRPPAPPAPPRPRPPIHHPQRLQIGKILRAHQAGMVRQLQRPGILQSLGHKLAAHEFVPPLVGDAQPGQRQTQHVVAVIQLAALHLFQPAGDAVVGLLAHRQLQHQAVRRAAAAVDSVVQILPDESGRQRRDFVAAGKAVHLLQVPVQRQAHVGIAIAGQAVHGPGKQGIGA